MELKVLQYSLTVCKVKSISQIDFSKEFILLEGLMRNYRSCVLRRILRGKRLRGRMAGEAFEFKEFWTFR